jgi:eukaryotic-like serine/threonine-protein kinase
MKLKQGTLIADRYKIIEQIGLGGMAIVYRAKDIKLNRDVTFKVMREDFIQDEEFEKRFEVEARAAASLSNQNIVKVYDIGQEDMVRFIVMEYIDGVNLKELIKRKAPFENDETLGVAIQIANALSHAHSHNIVHRDIKPQNILITNEGDVKVTDFGIARATSSNTVTVSSNSMGSVHYFSPEQARGGYIDDKTDVYSLGLVMFEMATGSMPYDGETPVSIAIKHINDSLPDMKKLNPNISESIIKIILKATEKISSKRYANVNLMLKDLKKALTYISEDFEINHENLENSPTLKLSEKDMEEIKKESKLAFFNEDLETDNNKLKEDKRYNSVDKNDNEKPKMSERNVVILAILTSIVIIVFVMTIGFFRLTRNINPQQELESLLGKTLVQAQELTAQHDISVVEIARENHDDIEEGLIISQDVGEDGNIESVTVINVVTSLGPAMARVPNLINRDFIEARQILRDYNFTYVERYVINDRVPNNVIFEQNPHPGELVNDNTEIELTISRGEGVRMVNMPTLVGLTNAEAVVLVQNLGLTVGHGTSQYSDTVPEGNIIEQSIEAGRLVAIASPVSFVISLGPELAYVEEEPEPTPTPTPAPVINRRVIQIEGQNLPENSGAVRMRIVEESELQRGVIFDSIVETSEFPMDFTVEGNGIATYTIYMSDENGIADTRKGQVTINFSEGAN